MYIESDTVELKERYTKDIIKEIIAFLNTKGGDIYIGIKDNGEVIGVKEIDLTISQIASAISDNIRPDAKMFIHLKVLSKDIICIHIEEGTIKPYYIQGKGMKPGSVYVRLGSASVPSSEAGIKQMIISSMYVNYELLPSIRQDLSFDSAQEFYNDNQMTLTKSDMRKLKMIDSHQNYTNLALLISDQCQHSIKIAVFSNEDEFEFVDRREFKGSIFTMLKNTLQYLDLNNHLNSKIVGYQREERYDYNPESIREGVLNAIIHRDYAFSGSVLIGIFINRIEITSLGGLVHGLSFEDIDVGISQARNPNLANVFYRLKYVEAYGTGIRKIKRDYQEYKLSQLVQVTDNTFKLTLWNKNYHTKSVVKDSITPYSYLTDEEEKILELIQEKRKIKRKDVQKFLGIGQTKAGLIIKKMIDKKLIIKEGQGKTTTYTYY